MENINKIERSELWNGIYELVNQIKLAKSEGDYVDKPYLTTSLENLFIEKLINPNVKYNKIELLQDMRCNKIELLQEDIECIHMFLDDLGVNRKDDNDTLSVVGRIKNIITTKDKRIEELENKSCWK